MSEHHLETTISGRYLVEVPDGDGPFPLLAGFHGYGQTAEDELELLRKIPCSEPFVLCAIEAQHSFINSKGQPGASWMTRRDRELRIAENVRYVDAVIGRVMAELPVDGRLVLHGFSQGAGMACRAAVLGRHAVSAVMLLGGDIPPELNDLAKLHAVQIGCGSNDHFYRKQQLDSDVTRLREAGIDPTVCEYAGGHVPTDDYFKAAGRFLTMMR
ncbi:phospholipase/Carboxylesterase [Chlorobaculum parvum NCIB 8327]|uniref:Phospholipase/Carboxylesterase n=1 Tax=Chlorobaculum parvum (strain DSM 263 / NCIMB 8327) TaxID=517417 RepID=B3QLB3_CHLP8|nr:phospholipase [Chlorobaculum parvum]ACF12351.1 phospholipase/Carboxylesterase [Chlorobaculum parvum NCIB 8327]